MVDRNAVQADIAELVKKFTRDSNRAQSEADVRAGYVDLLFHALGWNVYNDPGHATNYRREGYIRGAGFVDVGLEMRGAPVIFLEAKRFGRIPSSQERTGDRSTEEKQAFRYARGKKIAYAILTNFERLHLFNADHERLIFAFDRPQEYLDNFEALWRLSPEEVERGSLPWWDGQLAKKDIDLEFLAALRRWRLALANAIYQHNTTNPALYRDGSFDFDQLMAAVQRILDRLILVRFGDDKEVLLTHDLLDTILAGYHNRGAYAGPDYLMREFIDLSHSMDKLHNTTLFAPGHVCDQVTLPNDVLAQVIDQMNRISFRKFTSDILGNTYESYLGTKLTLRGGEIEDEERRDVRKGRGIYYTPRWVVEYIVDNTLGRRLKELEQEHGLHAIEKARGLAVLDPACGSGSFLIYAYQVLADFYRRLNDSIDKERVRLMAELQTPQMSYFLEQFTQIPQPVLEYAQVILKEHLFGVDLDPEAAEIASVNLTMQAFADSRQRKLPMILNENIKVGNSLISGAEEELHRYFGDSWGEKRPFNWEQEFPEIMARGGFDVVIGNPPYVDVRTMGDDNKPYFKSHYHSAMGMFDVYVLFVEKGLSLLRNGGSLSLIISNKFLASDYGRKLRELLLDKYLVQRIVNLADLGVFKEASIYPSIVTIKRDDDVEPESHAIEVISGLRHEMDISRGTYSKVTAMQGSLRKLNKSIIPLEAGRGDLELIAKVISTAVRLKDLCDVKAGIHVGNVKRKIVVSAKLFDSCKKLVTGSSMTRYSINWDGAYVIYDPKIIDRPAGEWAHFRDEVIFTSKEKLFVRYIGERLHAAYDDDQFYSLDTAYVVNAKNGIGYQLKYILGVLNSRFLTWVYATFYGSLRVGGGYLRFIGNNLEQLPIRRIDFANPEEKAMHDRLVALVERMLDLNKRKQDTALPQGEREDIEREIARTDQEIDSLVYELYGLTQEERELVEQAAQR